MPLHFRNLSEEVHTHEIFMTCGSILVVIKEVYVRIVAQPCLGGIVAQNTPCIPTYMLILHNLSTFIYMYFVYNIPLGKILK